MKEKRKFDRKLPQNLEIYTLIKVKNSRIC